MDKDVIKDKRGNAIANEFSAGINFTNCLVGFPERGCFGWFEEKEVSTGTVFFKFKVGPVIFQNQWA
jgi:hypothetical protein